MKQRTLPTDFGHLSDRPLIWNILHFLTSQKFPRHLCLPPALAAGACGAGHLSETFTFTSAYGRPLIRSATYPKLVTVFENRRSATYPIGHLTATLLYTPYAARTLAVRARGFERATFPGCRTKPEAKRSNISHSLEPPSPYSERTGGVRGVQAAHFHICRFT